MSDTESTPPWEPSPEVRRALDSLHQPATLRNSEQLEAAGLALMQAAAEWSEANPSPDGDLEEQFEKCANALDWTGTIQILNELTQRAEGRSESHKVYFHQRRLSNLLHLLRQTDAAQRAASRATAAARRVANMPVLVAMALEGECVLNLRGGQASRALEQINEAVALIGTETVTRLSRARALVLRAACQIDLGDLAAAEPDLAEAGPTLQALGDSACLAGAQSGLAWWHETQAKLHRARGEHSQALESQRLGVFHRRIVSEAPQIERYLSGGALARSLQVLAEIQHACGDEHGTNQSRAEAQRIWADLKIPAPDE